MTDENKDVSLSEENVNQADVLQDASLSKTDNCATSETEEKTLTQSQVNKIVAREKREAEQKAARAYEQRLAEHSAENVKNNGENANNNLSSSQIAKLVREEAARLAATQYATTVANAFESKIRQAIHADPDFSDDYDALNIEAHPRLVMMTNELENTADVIRDFARNPSKLANELLLANSGGEELAKRELSRLSSSIKTNKAALSQKKAPAPLGQIKSSSTTEVDDTHSIKSFRSNPKYRG